MSHRQTERAVENLVEIFHDHLQSKDVAKCREIISNLREMGLDDVADSLVRSI